MNTTRTRKRRNKNRKKQKTRQTKEASTTADHVTCERRRECSMLHHRAAQKSGLDLILLAVVAAKQMRRFSPQDVSHQLQHESSQARNKIRPQETTCGVNGNRPLRDRLRPNNVSLRTWDTTAVERSSCPSNASKISSSERINRTPMSSAGLESAHTRQPSFDPST